jgi:methionyl-tRNA formyltransferase
LPTVYLGTSEFAAAVLRALAASQFRPALVVSRPDAPFGRGRRLRPPPAAAAATELGIDIYQPENVNSDDANARIAAAAATTAPGSEDPVTVVVCAFGALIKEPLLSAHPMLNVHPSLLPRWRGAAPIERAMIAGDPTTGVSIMQLTAGLDSGPVCLQRQAPIRPDDTYGTLSQRLEQLGGALLIRALDEAPPFTEQPDDGVTYAEKLTAEDRVLDGVAATAAELERRVRALTPHIGAYIRRPEGDRLGVHAAAVTPSKDRRPDPGELSLDGRLPVLGCAADSALELTVVQPPGRKPMPAADWLRGLRR